MLWWLYEIKQNVFDIKIFREKKVWKRLLYIKSSRSSRSEVTIDKFYLFFFQINILADWEMSRVMFLFVCDSHSPVMGVDSG